MRYRKNHSKIISTKLEPSNILLQINRHQKDTIETDTTNDYETEDEISSSDSANESIQRQKKNLKDDITFNTNNVIDEKTCKNYNNKIINLYEFLRIDKEKFLASLNEDDKKKYEFQISSKPFIEYPSLPKRLSVVPLSICVGRTRYKIIPKVANDMGWKVVRESQNWNLLWSDSVPSLELYKEMKRFQKVNHFPGMEEICRKDLLARNLGRMLKLYPEEYNFYPKTWVFPADFGEAIMYNREHRNKYYILKPDTGAQGRGIFLTKNLKDIKPTERLICQVYVKNPLLIDGYKFDLRVYTVVTAIDPLRIFVFNEGLVRFATSKYEEPCEENNKDLFMHLTNYSVNRRNKRFFIHDSTRGSKRKFCCLNEILVREGYDAKALWKNIDDTINKTILSCWPMVNHNYKACFPGHDITQACFEILGFDILVDDTLKPFVLEVNHSPSFSTEGQVDKEVKESLIHDTLNLLSISLIDKRKILTEDKKRVKQRLLRDRRRTLPDIPNEHKHQQQNKSEPQISHLGQQIGWEETHMGGFRRIMPPDLDNPRYTEFFQLQSQASIYGDTTASKMREVAAKECRRAILEKEKQMIAMKPKPRKIPTNPPKRLRPVILKKGWSADSITMDKDERDRLNRLAERDVMIRNNGIFGMIFKTFYYKDLLSDSDRRKYPDFYNYFEENNQQTAGGDNNNNTSDNDIEKEESFQNLVIFNKNLSLPIITTTHLIPASF